MLGTLLEKKLKTLEGKVILVVTDDGMAFAGKLVEFDKTTLVMQDVHQGSTTKINWHDINPIEKEDMEEGSDNGSKYGFVEWASVNLNEVYINIEHVSRIWPWEQTSKQLSKENVVYSKPIYYKSQAQSNRATMGMDVPEKLF